MKSQEQRLIEAGFTHPCKGTCSGYSQAKSEVLDAVLERLDGYFNGDDSPEVIAEYFRKNRSSILGTDEGDK